MRVAWTGVGWLVNEPVFRTTLRMDDDAEFTLQGGPDVVLLGELEAGRPRVASRGAAHEAYHLLFALPFDRAVVDAYVDASADESPPSMRIEGQAGVAASRSTALRRTLAWGSLGVGTIGAGAAAFLSVSAASEASGAPPSQSEAARRNARIAAFETGAAAGYIAGGAAIALGAALLLWPDSRHVRAVASPSGAFIGYESAF